MLSLSERNYWFIFNVISILHEFNEFDYVIISKYYTLNNNQFTIKV